MKKIILGVLVMMSSYIIFGQQNSLIRMTPKEGQGFLVLERIMDNQNVNHWLLEVKHSGLDADSNVVYTIVDRQNLYDQNFIKFSDTIYKSNRYVFNVKAYDMNNYLIGETGDVSMAPPGLPAYELHKTWKCNGFYYAYEIQQYLSYDQSHSIVCIQSTGTGYAVSPYYYQYTGSLSGADALKAYHHIPYQYLFAFSGYSANGQLFHSYPNDPNIYYSATGTPLNEAWGVAKSMGPWYDDMGHYISDANGNVKHLIGGHLIVLNEGEIIPTGGVVNRLEFIDGSVITFQSVKN